MTDNIRIGPSGLGSKDGADKFLEDLHKKGLRACELAFVYGVYLDKKSAEEIGKKANELRIYLSIHAPYYVNLNSADKKKLEMSKKRILDCCEIGHYLSSGSKRKISIVFHAGFYGDSTNEETFQNIKNEILEMIKIVEKNKWNIELCPEIMGKRNVFGSIEDISRLVKETGCGCCIDFAHVLARYDNNNFDLIKKNFGGLSHWHCHFSGIVYGDKGEKNHKQTEEKEWVSLLNFLKDFKFDISLISEAPNPVGDSEEGRKIFERLTSKHL